jgi:hypothetical protein
MARTKQKGCLATVLLAKLILLTINKRIQGLDKGLTQVAFFPLL